MKPKRKLKTRLWPPLLALLLIMLLSGGCDPAARYVQDPEVIASQSYRPETVYLGVVLPLSGAYAEQAAQMRAAMETAIDIVNHSHDLDWPLARNAGLAGYGNAQVELVFGDCESDRRLVAAAADDLLSLGVSGLIGAYDSDYTAIAARRAAVAGKPMLAGSAKSYELTDGESYDFGVWFNRVAPIDDGESALFFDYIKHLNLTQAAGINKLAIAYLDNDYGRHVLETFDAYAAEYGLEVVARIIYQPGIENVALEASRMIANQPDALFQVSSLPDLSQFASAYAAAQYNPKIAFCYSGGFQQGDFAALTRGLGLDWFAGLMMRPAAKEGANTPQDFGGQQIYDYINSLYRARTGQNMNASALLEFTSVIVMAEAVNNAGTTQSEILAQTLRQQVFAAPYLPGGSVDFDDQGQNVLLPGYLALIVDGEYTDVFPL
ncbi:MAG: ABC transporter substrate-binding protein [Clostridia bacterium]|nr:ABC transporter substrate-binding protein [Clostridia bacterium]